MTGLAGKWLSLCSLTFLWPGKRSIRDAHAMPECNWLTHDFPVSWRAPHAVLWIPGMHMWPSAQRKHVQGLLQEFGHDINLSRPEMMRLGMWNLWWPQLRGLNLPIAGEAGFPIGFKLFARISKCAFQDSHQMPSSPWLQSDSTSENTWDIYLHL